MTDQLRSLLEQAVPDDAPTLDPVTVAAAARQGQRRLRAVAGAGVAAVIVAGAATAALTTRGGDELTADDPAPSPYDAPACPATLPELADAGTSVGSLDGLTSVRMCPDLGPSALGTAVPDSQRKALLAGMDALVGDLSDFAGRVARTDAFDPARCATIDVLNTRQSLQLTYADGHTELVPTAACSPITVAGREIDGQFLGEAYLAALDHQRSSADYVFHGTVPLTCDLQPSPAPARPGRESIVAAVSCGPKGSAVALDERQLPTLAAAWGDPQPEPPYDENCNLRTDLPYLVAATDRGDVVVIRQQQCDVLTPQLAWAGVGGGEGIALPTTLDTLGLG